MNDSTITLSLPGSIRFTRLASLTASKTAELFLSSMKVSKGTDDFQHAFELSVSEAFTNAARYALPSSHPQPVTISFRFEEKQLTVSVTDSNPAFTIESPVPDIENYPEGGYGLLLIRSLMDTVSCRRENNTNTITMSKQPEIL